jgi:hypothetical protein
MEVKSAGKVSFYQNYAPLVFVYLFISGFLYSASSFIGLSRDRQNYLAFPVTYFHTVLIRLKHSLFKQGLLLVNLFTITIFLYDISIEYKTAIFLITNILIFSIHFFSISLWDFMESQDVSKHYLPIFMVSLFLPNEFYIEIVSNNPELSVLLIGLLFIIGFNAISLLLINITSGEWLK